MAVPSLESLKAIEHQYATGETPVLVVCSDLNAYVCKYMRSSTSAFKLVCELIGSEMAIAWQLDTPSIAFVRIKQEHWAGRSVQHSISAPSLGSRKIEGVVDINPYTYSGVSISAKIMRQLMKIALFDFWIANEDRNVNNANLLYVLDQEKLVSIDYGCILNTASFDFPMTQLTSNESILCSDLFLHLVKGKEIPNKEAMLKDLKVEYDYRLILSKAHVTHILEDIPKEWNVPTTIVEQKLEQLFDVEWTIGVWDNFVECLNSIISNE